MQETSTKLRECEPLEQEFVRSLLERYRPALIGYFRARVGDLAERANAYRVHQHLEHVLVVDDCLLKALEHWAACGFVSFVKVV